MIQIFPRKDGILVGCYVMMIMTLLQFLIETQNYIK